MPDMLVNLLKLPPLDPLLAEAADAGLTVRRARAWELAPVRAFVESHFGAAWADETSVGFSRQPVSVFVATREGRVVGFAAYECTARNFFGPMGVSEAERGRRLGRALLVACLHAMREMDYAYAIIGGVGPAQFYERAVGATLIPESSPGVYTDLLRGDRAGS